MSEGCAAVQGPSVTLNGSFCAQVKARRILALDCERASAGGGASQDLRLKDKVVDVPTDVRGLRDREAADREVERFILRTGGRPGVPPRWMDIGSALTTVLVKIGAATNSN